MKNTPIVFFALSLFFISAGNCLSNKIDHYPSKVISLGPYITENLLALGINSQIIGVTIHERQEIKKGRKLIGTLLDPNIEIIVRLKPDLVIASKEGNRKETVEKLLNLGINVRVLEEVITYEDLKNNFLLLGEIFGKQKLAEKIISDVERELGKYKQKNTSKTIFWQLGTKPLVTAGRNTYFNEIASYAGVINTFGDMETKYITISTEEVIKRNPDIIVAMGMGEDTYVMDFWKPFRNIEAVKSKKIFKVDDYSFCSPTPLSFLKSVAMIHKFSEN